MPGITQNRSVLIFIFICTLILPRSAVGRRGAGCCCSEPAAVLNLVRSCCANLHCGNYKEVLGKLTDRLASHSFLLEDKRWCLIALLSKSEELFPPLSTSAEETAARESKGDAGGLPRLPVAGSSSADPQGNLWASRQKAINSASIPSPLCWNQIIGAKCFRSDNSVAFPYYKTPKVSKFPAAFYRRLEISMIWKLPFGITLLLFYRGD